MLQAIASISLQLHCTSIYQGIIDYTGAETFVKEPEKEKFFQAQM